MTPKEALYGYDSLWRTFRQAKNARKTLLKPPRSEEIIAQMVQHCRAAFALYSGVDPYRAAMWERRLWLHEHGRHNEVWDGRDPVTSLAALRAGDATGHGFRPKAASVA